MTASIYLRLCDAVFTVSRVSLVYKSAIHAIKKNPARFTSEKRLDTSHVQKRRKKQRNENWCKWLAQLLMNKVLWTFFTMLAYGLITAYPLGGSSSVIVPIELEFRSERFFLGGTTLPVGWPLFLGFYDKTWQSFIKHLCYLYTTFFIGCIVIKVCFTLGIAVYFPSFLLVMAQCKELGLEEEVSNSAPLPKRRRNRTSKAVLIPDEKAAIAAAQKSPSRDQGNSAHVEFTQLLGTHTDLDKHYERKCQPFHKPVEHNCNKTETNYPTGVNVGSLQLRERNSVSETSQTKDLETECFLNNDDVSLCRMRDKSLSPLETDLAGHCVKGYALGTPRTPSEHCRNSKEINKLGGVSGGLSEARTNSKQPLPRENAKPLPNKRENSREVNESLPDKLGWVGQDLLPCLEHIESSENKQGAKDGGLSVALTEFNVPPSPGHVEPLPNRLSLLHKLLKTGETLSSTKTLKF